MNLLTEFGIGFWATAGVVFRIAGGVAAVAVCAAVIIIAVCVAGLLFDGATDAIAKHWEKAGHRPRHRLGRIIAGSLARNHGKSSGFE